MGVVTIWIGMKDLCAETTELVKSLTTGCNPFADLDLASLCSVDTSTLTDTLKAAANEYNFSEVCLTPPALVTACAKLRKFGEPLIQPLVTVAAAHEAFSLLLHARNTCPPIASA